MYNIAKKNYTLKIGLLVHRKHPRKKVSSKFFVKFWQYIFFHCSLALAQLVTLFLAFKKRRDFLLCTYKVMINFTLFPRFTFDFTQIACGSSIVTSFFLLALSPSCVTNFAALGLGAFAPRVV